MCRTSHLCSHRRMHWIILIITNCVGDRKFFI